MIFVIAGNKKDAQDWANKNEIKPNGFKFIDKKEDFLGYVNMTYVYAKNYMENPLWSNKLFSSYALAHNYVQWRG